MHTATTGRTRPVIDRRNNRAVRDIAKLRARRAARLAAESAAGRRRMVVTGVCALSTVVPVPAPTYASRERVRGRIVHADTDLRGIPRIAAAVPARPIAQTAQVGARSTAEVVADQAVALDLDAVLDARRAQ